MMCAAPEELQGYIHLGTVKQLFHTFLNKLNFVNFPYQFWYHKSFRNFLEILHYNFDSILPTPTSG